MINDCQRAMLILVTLGHPELSPFDQIAHPNSFMCNQLHIMTQCSTEISTLVNTTQSLKQCSTMCMYSRAQCNVCVCMWLIDPNFVFFLSYSFV